MTPATVAKRNALLEFISRVLAKETAVKGVVGIGSIASGRCHPDSDIDAALFLDPCDYFIAPAEALWDPEADAFYSIFTADEELQQQAIPLDFARLSWSRWQDPAFSWPEARRAELRHGWIAYDPTAKLAGLINRRTSYPDDLRRDRLDEAITWLDQHLNWDSPQEKWDRFGPLIAHDRLEAAYHYLVAALFALNREWRPWRNRQMGALLDLSWLPDAAADRLLLAGNAPALDFAGYHARWQALQELFAVICDKALSEGIYQQDPIGEAFIRGADEPGRAWNMDEWNRKRAERLARR